MNKVLFLVLTASLGGCATQFGTRTIAHSVHHHVRKAAVVAHGVPAPVPAQGAVPIPTPVPAVPEQPKSFFQRHPIQWLHH